jgi:hypothetical protein
MRTLLVLLCSGVALAGEMPSPWVAYADVIGSVKAGIPVKMAVGVPAPDGFVAVKDATDYGVEPGLWSCYRDGNVSRMVRVNTPKSLSYVARWTHPPDLRGHLMGENHGFSADKLDGLSVSEMQKLHDEDHDRKRVAPVRQPLLPYTPLPNVQSYLRPGAFTPYCPPGRA